MDLQTFLAKLAALTLLPEQVSSYAADTAPRMSDEDRAALMRGIEAQYAQIQKLEGDREKNFDDGMKELLAINRKHVPAIRHAVEAQDQAAEADSATKKLDDNI